LSQAPGSRAADPVAGGLRAGRVRRRGRRPRPGGTGRSLRQGVTGCVVPSCRRHERASGKESMVPPQAFFGTSVALSFVAWGIIAARYLWPALRSQPRARALRPLLLLHSFRFIGLAFLVPGVVSPDLPGTFARPAAYGDLVAAVLALLALAGLQSRLGIVLVWVFNRWGSGDLLYAFYQGFIGGRFEVG